MARGLLWDKAAIPFCRMQNATVTAVWRENQGYGDCTENMYVLHEVTITRV